jgi:hypothetical protein
VTFPIDEQVENDGNHFNGWGPTVFLEARRPIGCRGLALYGDARVGVLFGNRHENCVQANSIDLEPFITTTRSSDSDQVIELAEIELGVEWAAHNNCRRIQPFARVGLEGRGYFGTGNAQSGANNNPIQPIIPTGFPHIPSLGHTADIGLYGLVVSAGVRF